VCNFTPVPREDYRIGVTASGRWEEVLNSDAEAYAGSGRGNLGTVEATADPFHGRPHSMELSLPPLSALFLRGPGDAARGKG
jgi:1,4-alpha-glucan branching enzyme